MGVRGINFVLFLLDFGTVLTVWKFAFIILFKKQKYKETSN